MVLLLFSLSTHLGCAMQNKEKKKVKWHADASGDSAADDGCREVI